MQAFEVNFDGLVGPTHNYGGLAFGNLSSSKHAFSVSSPKEAAKQGLAKMKKLAELGLYQGVLPPHERPDLKILRKLGFRGDDIQILENAHQQAPEIFTACFTASSMWTANAATVSPSADTADRKVHFTPANLSSNFHRSLEAPTTARILKTIFSDEKYFNHHDPLPGTPMFSDEGAANHTRFCLEYNQPGLELFTYGRQSQTSVAKFSQKFPARQTLEASTAVARMHQLDLDKVVLAQQNPEAIDAGVFHNDVISVGNRNVFLYHSKAFVDTKAVIGEIQQKFGHAEIVFIEVSEMLVSLDEAVRSYLFNSQIVTLPNRHTILVAPIECQESKAVKTFLDQLIARDNPIDDVLYFDLRQSMKNGGGPACLRLRIVMTEEEIKKSHPPVYLDNHLYAQLDQWIEKYYREQLHTDDLIDPQLLEESRCALDELTQMLQLGSIYPFQQV